MKEVFTQYENYRVNTPTQCFVVDAYNFFNYKVAGSDYLNYRFPVTTHCAHNKTVVSGLVADSYALKTNKFLNFKDSQNIVFDVHGVWLEQSVIRNLFKNTPDYMKDYHEDDSKEVDESTPC